MASFISGLKKSKKHQVLKEVTGKQMGVTEDSSDSIADQIKEDNKQLQLKVEQNEKLIQRLQWEQTEHEQILKLKEHAKKNNLKMLAEQKMLMNNWRELEMKSERQFGAQIKQASERIEALDKEIVDTREESVQLDIATKNLEDDTTVGEQYFLVDKMMMERMVEGAKRELEQITGKLDQLKAARAKRGRIYNSVDEFMAERAMIVDLAMSRGQAVKTKEEDNKKVQKDVDALQKTAAALQKRLDKLQRH